MAVFQDEPSQGWRRRGTNLGTKLRRKGQAGQGKRESQTRSEQLAEIRNTYGRGFENYLIFSGECSLNISLSRGSSAPVVH